MGNEWMIAIYQRGSDYACVALGGFRQSSAESELERTRDLPLIHAAGAVFIGSTTPPDIHQFGAICQCNPGSTSRPLAGPGRPVS